MSAAASPAVRRLADWDAARLRDLASTHGTPLYVADLDRARANLRRLAAAFPDADVRYAVKANAARPLLRAAVAEGAGLECASAGEVALALDAAAAVVGPGTGASSPGARIDYTAVNPPARDLDRVVELWTDHPGLTVTAGAADTVDRLAERGYDGRLCVRVHPGVGAGHHEKVATGTDATFGVPPERALDLVADAADRDFEVVGLHAHAGSGIAGEDLAAHRELVALLGDLARRAPVDLEYVNAGGGFGVPSRPGEEPLDLAGVAAATRAALGDVDAGLAIEPGRYVAADAGLLLTRANTVKRAGGTTVVGVDAGMNALVRPALYDAHHELRTLAPDAGDRDRVAVTVAGPVCESADVLAADRALPAPARGDLLAVGNAGAYGFEMASQYNARPRPARVALDGDRVVLVRRRETVADLAACDQDPAAPDREVDPS